MTLEPADKKTLSDIRMGRAQECLADAKANFGEGRYKTAINRSYYAALNAARALLVLEGANPLSHEDAVTMLSLRFVKPGLLPVDTIKTFKVLLSRRTDVDYGDFETIGSSDVEDSLASASQIIETMEKVRLNLIRDL